MSKKKTVEPGADGMPLVLLTNERTQYKANQLIMLYKAASVAQLAYMDGMDPDTGEIVPLLVGLEAVAGVNQFKVYPLAKLIGNLSEIKSYLVPDGAGGYVDYTVPETLPSQTDDGTEHIDLAILDDASGKEEGTPE